MLATRTLSETLTLAAQTNVFDFHPEEKITTS